MSISFEIAMQNAEGSNIKLEFIKGVPVWEASPVFQHQWEVDRIRASIKPLESDKCACISIADVLFRFPDGSQKRPDIAILCAMPDRSTTETALEVIPAAVVEIISKNYEYKDLVLAPPFYLENNVKDILIFNPTDNSVLHYCPNLEQPKVYTSPITLNLECGCEITV